uniref:Uncharacterized protein n=1 Tax=Oryza meridionalis TaxID=40149 RepID=A0A0E0CW53_9ORYZ
MDRLAKLMAPESNMQSSSGSANDHKCEIVLYGGFQVLNREQRTAHRTAQKLEKREKKNSIKLLLQMEENSKQIHPKTHMKHCSNQPERRA